MFENVSQNSTSPVPPKPTLLPSPTWKTENYQTISIPSKCFSTIHRHGYIFCPSSPFQSACIPPNNFSLKSMSSILKPHNHFPNRALLVIFKSLVPSPPKHLGIETVSQWTYLPCLSIILLHTSMTKMDSIEGDESSCLKALKLGLKHHINCTWQNYTKGYIRYDPDL